MTCSQGENQRRIYLITGSCLQSAAFAGLIQERMGVSCSISGGLGSCIATVAMSTHPTLIIVDCCHYDQSRVIAELEGLPHRPGNHVMTALMNMPRGSGLAPHAVTLGVRAVFYAGTDFDAFSRGVTAVFAGEIWISREVLADALMEQDHEGPNHDATTAKLLTQRERQILALISIGCSNDEIAGRLNISSNTVRTHIYNLFRKINVPNRMQAALWGAENL